MSIHEELARLWAAIEPPARDSAFAHAVMTRIARQSFRWELLDLLSGVLVLGLIARVLAPSVDRLVVAGITGATEVATSGVLFAFYLLTGIWLLTEGRPYLLGD